MPVDRQQLLNDWGFTVVELLIVLVLVSVVLAGAYSLFSYVYQSWARVEEESLRIQEARLAIDTVGKEIRNAAPLEDNSIGVKIHATPQGQGRELRLGPAQPGQIRYRLDENNRLYRQVLNTEGLFEDSPGEIAALANDHDEEPFMLQGRVVKVAWKIDDSSRKVQLKPKTVKGEFAVRNGLVKEED